MNEYTSEITRVRPPAKVLSGDLEERYFERRRREIREDAQVAIAKVELAPYREQAEISKIE